MPAKSNLTTAALKLPQSKLAKRAGDLVREASPEYLFNHCARTFLFADALGKLDGLVYDCEILYIGCLMHDLGITEQYRGKSRFEVDGADAARKFLIENGVDENTAEIVWDAIALHATFHIPMRKRPEIALVHAGAAADIGGLRLGDLEPEFVVRILEEYPRKNLKQEIIHEFVDYLKQNPAGGRGYWMDQIAARYLPDIPRFCLQGIIENAPFAE